MEQYVTSEDLAFILKITSRRVNQLAKEDVILREQNGKFDVQNSVENFFRYKLQTDADKEISFDIEHARLEAAKRKKAELDLEERNKTLLQADEVEQLMAGMILTCKAKLLTIPSKVAPKILAANDINKIVAIIRGEIFEALNELKEIPAAKVVKPDAVDT